MKTAIIHEWLVTEAGAESVLSSIFDLFPAPIHTLFHDPDGLIGTRWEHAHIIASMLQRIPLARKHHRAFLPLFPMAIEQFDLRDYNLILSSSYAVAKGVLTSSDQLHICYCHSPMRYIWDLTFQYLEASGIQGGLKSFFIRAVFHYIRSWDVISSFRVNHFIANSHYIARRIKKCYNRDAAVIYPPVDIERFSISPKKGDYFITISRLVPYKRVDVIIEACSALNLKLVVVGDGPDLENLKKKAGKTIEFTGHLSPEKLAETLSQARAFIYSAEEDFGIVNVEAQAAGIPVIAYGKGGALETVVDKKTGLFFYQQSPQSLIDTLKIFLEKEQTFDPQIIRQNAELFPRSRFVKEYHDFVTKAWEEFPYRS